ncbi:MAG TPA: SDR family NAD(P)-dependent oxidoreductase [Clostridia bacterium]|nr:SDR family NAD(P)-dependent oxidoreductase [Clostridia bacterium]
MHEEKALKYVFFTGATGGLGAACVKLLSSRGWTVFAAGTNKKKLKTAGEIPNVIPVYADITDTDSILAARDTVLRHTDHLDAIVNFAGVTSFDSLVEGDPVPTAERLLSVNVMGTVRVNAIFFDLIERGRGRIVNCSSSAGWMTAQPFTGAYVMSKRAVEGYNDSLRRELMYLDIPVIKIQPGSFRTALTNDISDGYDRVFSETKRYRRVLETMKPLMDSTLNHSGNPDAVAKIVVRALEDKHPKQKYRISSGFLLTLLELLPETWVDAVYKLPVRRKP